MTSAKESLRKNFPRLHSTLSGLRTQLGVEYKVVRQIGVRNLLSGRLWNKASWKEALPIQKPLRVALPDASFASVDELVGQLDARGLSYGTGSHAIYLPPATLEATGFRALRERYPSDAGLKIARSPGGVGESQYVSAAGASAINRALSGDHGRLSLVANLLHQESLGPRLYDLVELDCNGQIYTGYVVEDVAGPEPTPEQCRTGIARLRELADGGTLQVTLPTGFDHKDLTPPSCDGNARMSVQGEFRYLDFQSFVLADYEPYLREVALRSVEDTHFGTESVLRRGRFLYQSVPGVNLPARRSIDDRVKRLSQMMSDSGLSVSDRLVLDVGCNIGMMMGEYLRQGARWCHGWDRARVTGHTEELLHGLGCTRFSTTGGDIATEQPMEEDIPAFLRPALDGCVISYLAVHGHVGWLDALARIPWSFIIYEGHQDDDRAQVDRDLAELRARTAFEVEGLSLYQDGLSDERFVALLRR